MISHGVKRGDQFLLSNRKGQAWPICMTAPVPVHYFWLCVDFFRRMWPSKTIFCRVLELGPKLCARSFGSAPAISSYQQLSLHRAGALELWGVEDYGWHCGPSHCAPGWIVFFGIWIGKWWKWMEREQKRCASVFFLWHFCAFSDDHSIRIIGCV